MNFRYFSGSKNLSRNLTKIIFTYLKFLCKDSNLAHVIRNLFSNNNPRNIGKLLLLLNYFPLPKTLLLSISSIIFWSTALYF